MQSIGEQKVKQKYALIKVNIVSVLCISCFNVVSFLSPLSRTFSLIKIFLFLIGDDGVMSDGDEILHYSITKQLFFFHS